jgi:hypothetical protein
MEQFNVETSRIVDYGNGFFYYELIPTNVGLKNVLVCGHDDEIVGTIEETMITEMAIQRVEMFDVLQMLHPEIAINYYL